ncbi:hypothetical protein CPB84DRAFT_1798531 [Gymnopilus junonius]|uniref:Uncharacterized protein n=1 Tax=Gymnopilus junonius TaxID=109634 RepID=A0A9P5N876_GYMJU|nr:hypothetical protein CPB84DRAFT_1798531 [Gymnopilus junonius]
MDYSERGLLFFKKDVFGHEFYCSYVQAFPRVITLCGRPVLRFSQSGLPAPSCLLQ